MGYLQGPFRNKKHIVLASKSPRRQRLLTSLGIYFEVVPSKIKEEKEGRSPEEIVKKNALKKATHIAKERQGVIIGADTIVVIEGKVLGKPQDKADALATLCSLMGKWHEVITGCHLIDNSISPWRKINFVNSSRVYIERVSRETLEAYISTTEPLDKAGSYAVQGIGAFLVKKIEGSYTNVVGLPLTEMVQALQKLGAIYATTHK